MSEPKKFQASLQPLYDSGILTPMFVDGEINPALPEETRKQIENGLKAGAQAIADDIDREIMEELKAQSEWKCNYPWNPRKWR